MIIDLLMLIVGGLIAEAIALYVLPNVFPNASPFFCASLLVCILAMERWNIKGAPIILVMSVITVLLGRLFSEISDIDSIHELTTFYCWRLVIINVISLSSSLLMILIKKFFGHKQALSNRIVTEGITLLIFIICVILQILSFWLVTFTFSINSIGVILINDMPALLVTLLFMAVLRHQGLFVDAKEDLISKKEEAELEQKYYSGLREQVIEKNDESKASKK